MFNTIEAAFTGALYDWLVSSGYTDVIQEGIETELKGVTDGEPEPYRLVPVKPGDARFKDPACKDRVVRITAHDVVDMSGAYPLIRFVVILPIDAFDRYLKDSACNGLRLL